MAERAALDATSHESPTVHVAHPLTQGSILSGGKFLYHSNSTLVTLAHDPAMLRLSTVLACLAALATASLPPFPQPSSHNPFSSEQISRLVVFGDSYSVQNVGDGRLQWPDWVAGRQYANVELFDFAQSGATCSQALTPRIFPAIMEDELPLYTTMQKNGSLPKLQAQNTLFAAWIGTNDVGAGCLLTGDQTQGVTLVDTTQCVAQWMQKVYALGGRNFLFLNVR